MRKEGKVPQNGFLRVEELQRKMRWILGHSRMSEDIHRPFQSILEGLPSNFPFTNTFSVTGVTFFHGTQLDYILSITDTGTNPPTNSGGFT